MVEELGKYRTELYKELEGILSFWIEHTLDHRYGGFIGRVDHYNSIDNTAPKGSVLNSRILWAFSAAYNLTKKHKYLEIANRAYDYFKNHFLDQEFGGVFWSVDYTGKALETKKQIYALAFAVYGFAEYYKITNDKEALSIAKELFNEIVLHSLDTVNGGYIEALSRDWNQLPDLRLSEKDANERKSMNTNLHALEAFTNLYKIWPDEILKQRLSELIKVFLSHMVSKKNYHLILFFDDQWQAKSDVISYGHDIEAAWLLQDAAEVINEPILISTVQTISKKIVDAATEGLDKDDGLWYEYDSVLKHLIKEKHSWPQAEAMIGYFNNWQNTSHPRYLQMSLRVWQFVQSYIKDSQYGEWYWGVRDDYSPMIEKDKVGIWKCPYHNSRACIEIIQRINKVMQE